MKLIPFLFATIFAHASAPPPNGENIEKLTHLKGSLNKEEGVFKVTFPRADLIAESGGVKLTPALGLTAWAAFQKTEHGTMLMGDLVLGEDQVNDVLDVALENGLEVTALHNHFLGEKPRVMFMHVGGHGEESVLARAVGAVFDKLKQKGSPTKTVNINPAVSHLDTAKIAGVLGREGELKDGVYKVTIGRTLKMHEASVGKTMGVNTWAAFAGTDQEAVVLGDFAMLEGEVQSVLKSLRKAGIQVVSIHNHMTDEVPRMMFLHYWGLGPAEKLAEGVRAALKTQKL